MSSRSATSASASLRRRRHRKHGVRASARANRKNDVSGVRRTCRPRRRRLARVVRRRRTASDRSRGSGSRPWHVLAAARRGRRARSTRERARDAWIQIVSRVRARSRDRWTRLARRRHGCVHARGSFLGLRGHREGGRWVDRPRARDGAFRTRREEKRDKCAQYLIDRVPTRH